MNSSSTTQKTILLVEDKQTIATTVSMVLNDAGYHVEHCLNGRVAIEQLASGFNPDLILLDVMMPVMDGYSALDAIKSSAPTSDIPVVMLTSLGDASDVMRALKSGAVDYCTKPIEPEDLLATIVRVLG